MTRLTDNLHILEKLTKFFRDNPDIRFFQGLQVLGLQKVDGVVDYRDKDLRITIKDNFNEESSVTLNKLNQ